MKSRVVSSANGNTHDVMEDLDTVCNKPKPPYVELYRNPSHRSRIKYTHILAKCEWKL